MDETVNRGELLFKALSEEAQDELRCYVLAREDDAQALAYLEDRDRAAQYAQEEAEIRALHDGLTHEDVVDALRDKRKERGL